MVPQTITGFQYNVTPVLEMLQARPNIVAWAPQRRRIRELLATSFEFGNVTDSLV